MRLQVALDNDLRHGLSVLEAVRPYIDIAEIGTPFVFREGIAAARRLRAAFPDVTLLADFKIMDAGEEEASIAFEAGCDIVTVLGVTQDSTVQGAVAAARRYSKQIMIDLMQVADKPARGRELLNMGCHYLCAHTAFDLQSSGAAPLGDLERLRRELGSDAPLAVAGGVSLQTIDQVAALKPAIVVVGGAITRAPDPAEAARAIHERIRHAAL
jgi:3-hexulose-6-phosphate synthase